MAVEEVAAENSNQAAGVPQAANTFTDDGPNSSNSEQSPAQPGVGDRSPGPCEMCGRVSGR